MSILRQAEAQAKTALELIITIASQQLHDKYLSLKVPGSSKQALMAKITGGIEPMVYKDPVGSTIYYSQMPRPARIDQITPSKIVFRSKSEMKIRKTENNFFHTQIRCQSNNIEKESDSLPKQRPKTCLKISGTNPIRSHYEDTARQQRIKRQKQQQDRNQRDIQIRNEIDWKKRSLLKKVNQLVGKGAPIAYDDEGKLLIQDMKQFKKQVQASGSKGSKGTERVQPFSLKYTTLQIQNQSSRISQCGSVSGRKRGFSSSRLQYESKLSPQQFSNHNQRQYSVVPFVDLSVGVKIVQKQPNIMAQKQKQPHQNRQEFFIQTTKSLFKSFLPDSEQVSYRAINSSRPNTNSNNREIKAISNSASAKSITVRAQTARPPHKVTVLNKKLAAQLITY